MEMQVSLEVAEISTSSSMRKSCLICRDRSDGSHFGVDSCRACAAFFRRSVTGAKNYHCRQGRDSCEVSKSIKSICRRCRLTKCLRSGMKPESVRDPIPSKPDPFLPSTSKIQNAFKKVNPLKTVSIDVDSNMLSHIHKEYTKLCSVRRATELAMSGDAFRGIFGNKNSPVKGFTMGTFSKVSLYLRAHLPAMGDFISNCFPEFNELDADEKWRVFKSFVCHCWGLDNNYRTAKLIPKELHDTICVITETCYVDLTPNGMKMFFADSMKEHSQQEMAKLVPTVFIPQRYAITKPLLEMDLDSEEYAFLLGLILWGPDHEKSNPKIDELSQKMREKLHKALEFHYEEKGLVRYAVRLGKLHTIHCATFQTVSMLREYTELFNLLDAYESDSFIHDFIKT